jgi:hypothetical protein
VRKRFARELRKGNGSALESGFSAKPPLLESRAAEGEGVKNKTLDLAPFETGGIWEKTATST